LRFRDALVPGYSRRWLLRFDLLHLRSGIGGNEGILMEAAALPFGFGLQCDVL
jgi:hypothetical protein